MPEPVEFPETRRFSPHEIKLIRGAYEVMARVGTQQMSLRALGKELGVTAQLLIYHFGSRENLLRETMHWALAGTVRRIRRHVSGITDPEEALSALMDAVFVGAKENRDFHLVYMDLVQYAVRHPTFTGLTDLLRDHINGSYAGVIRLGVDSGVFSVVDVELAAKQARAIVEGGFLQWLQEDDWLETHATLRADCHRALLKLLSSEFEKTTSRPADKRRRAAA